MDQLPFDNPQELHFLLTEIMCVENSRRHAAERILIQMRETDDLRLSTSLLDHFVLLEDTDQTIQQISLILIKNSMQRYTDAGSISPEIINSIRQKILNLMLSDKTHERIKRVTQQILEVLFKHSSSPKDIEPDLVLIKEKTLADDLNTQTTLFGTLKSLFHVPSRIKAQLVQPFEEFADWLIQVGNKQTQSLIEEARNVRESIRARNRLTELSFFPIKVQALESWILAVIQLMEGDFLGGSKKNSETVVDLLQNKQYYQRLPQILKDILTINLAFDRPDNNTFITTPTDSPNHYEINSMKTEALNLLILVLEILEPHNSKIDLTKLTFFQAIHNDLVKLILNGLSSLLNSDEYHELCENEETGEIENLLGMSASFLRQAVSFKQICLNIDVPLTELLLNVCLPIMRMTPQEIEQTLVSPTDYINTLAEICFEQKASGTRKGISAFLCVLASQIDNKCGPSLLKLLLSLAEYSLATEDPEELANYPELIQYQDSRFITQVQPESRIEACLITISCLHKVANNDIKKMIGKFLKEHYAFLVDSQQKMFKIYLCFLIACYPESLFLYQEDQDLSENYIRFILESVNIKDEEENGLVDAANKALEIIFANKSVSVFLVPYAMDALRVLTQIFLDSNKPSLIDSIMNILINYELQVLEQPDFLFDFLKTLGKNIEDVLRKDKAPGQENLDVEHTMKLFEKICEQNKYISMIQNDLGEIIHPLFTLLQDINIKTLDDQFDHQNLIIILNLLIPMFPESIPIILSNVSNILPQILEMKVSGGLNYLVSTVNEILLHCHAVSEFNPGTIHTLIEIGTKMIEQNSCSASLNLTKQNIVCEGAMILQLVFQYVEPLTDTQTEEILNRTYQQYIRTQNPLIRVQLLSVVISAISAKFEAIQKALHIFINPIIENALNFSNIPYLRKIFILGLSRVLGRTNLPEFFTLRLPELLNILVSFAQLTQLQRQTKEEESDKIHFKSSKDLLQGFLNDQTIMEEEKTCEKEVEEDSNVLKEYFDTMLKEMTDTLKTKIKDKDELEFFQDEILLFNKNHPERLQSLIQNLSEKKKEFIEKILSL